MNDTEFLSTLRKLAAAFPNAPMSEDTLSVWAEYFADRDARDFAEAADEWIGVEERFPTIAQFKRYVGVAARRRRQAAITDEIEATAPRDRTGEHNIALVREALQAALRKDDETHPEDAAAAALADARPVLTVGPPIPVTTAHHCSRGFVEDLDTGAVIPCRECNYPAYQRWVDGQYRPREFSRW